MNIYSRKIQHPLGSQLVTPALVPSYSSRGFKFRGKASEAKRLIELTKDIISESCLLSAYDIAHGYVHKPEKLPFTPELTFVDSGGYETGDSEDLSTVYHYPISSENWKPYDYYEILDKWPSHLPAVFISYDSRRNIKNQIADAERFRQRYDRHLTCYLIKPPRRKRKPFKELIPDLEREIGVLKNFPIIGVTEKELGFKFRQRIESVSALRRMLDKHGVDSAIHVFGALDPLSTKLYFLAGAEIFDGLAWLRFAFSGGSCVYMHNAVARTTLDMDDETVERKVLVDNYTAILKLQIAMRTFQKQEERDWSLLSPDEDTLRNAYDSLVAVRE